MLLVIAAYDDEVKGYSGRAMKKINRSPALYGSERFFLYICRGPSGFDADFVADTVSRYGITSILNYGTAGCYSSVAKEDVKPFSVADFAVASRVYQPSTGRQFRNLNRPESEWLPLYLPLVCVNADHFTTTAATQPKVVQPPIVEPPFLQDMESALLCSAVESINTSGSQNGLPEIKLTIIKCISDIDSQHPDLKQVKEVAVRQSEVFRKLFLHLLDAGCL